MIEFVSVGVDSFGVNGMTIEEEQLGSMTDMTKIKLVPDPSPTQVELITFLVIFFFIAE